MGKSVALTLYLFVFCVNKPQRWQSVITPKVNTGISHLLFPLQCWGQTVQHWFPFMPLCSHGPVAGLQDRKYFI